jgi:ferric-dicitrate binding protein FerR (iron transport regulator)
VSVSPGATRIVVREGRVQLGGTRHQTQITAGERIDIDEAGRVSRASVPSFGESWEWVSMIVPAIDLDNRPLSEFLSWMIREHGWQLRYATPRGEQTVQAIRLHASAQGKTPLETLQRVSLITGLTLELENGVLIVGDRHD